MDGEANIYDLKKSGEKTIEEQREKALDYRVISLQNRMRCY